MFYYARDTKKRNRDTFFLKLIDEIFFFTIAKVEKIYYNSWRVIFC